MTERFGGLLRRARKAAKMTMGDVARETGRSVSYISDVELGQRKPFKAPEIVRIARLLGTDAQPLIEAATRERGAVHIASQREDVMETAAGFARSADRLSPKKLEEIRKILEEEEG